MENAIVIKDVNKSFIEQKVLDDINLSIKKNEIVSIIGPSGSGKSTLLRIIAGLEKPCKGKVLVNGSVGMVFQHGHLWPHKRVLDNVTEPLKAKNIQKCLAEKKAEAWLTRLGLENKMYAFPETLSGGEIQRVAIARTLVTNPNILLLDEITSALDPVLVSEILECLRMLAKEKRTLVIVTHEIAFAKEISNRIIFLNQGSIVEAGHPWKIISNPDDSKTRKFLSSILTR